MEVEASRELKGFLPLPCARLDLNQHVPKDTRLSFWLVYLIPTHARIY